ncbi:hypothetical protein OV208_28650 [Corallococcus sp. bb12-1]|uniref:hypothetical protein n=1 Tax=Corallococcus sp. bb12-1 TaxID=2996784 RepID=UPI00226F8874|nr:hypothetical protein [Corallococcus sp. bb12-1]MCY1045320.1 hypothetical protein [Corallococcus sp. bb12-1]
MRYTASGLFTVYLFLTTTAYAAPKAALGVYATRSAPPVKKLSGTGAEPPWNWLEPSQWEADTGSQQAEELLGWLLSGERAQRAEAGIRLLSRGAALLPKLEALALRTREPEAREALLGFLRALTAQDVAPQQLDRYPALSALAAKDLARGRELASKWEKAPARNELIEEVPYSWCGTPPLPPTRLLIEGSRLQELRNALETLSGLGRPGLEQLMASPSALVRLQGLVLAEALKLRPDPATLTRLRSDAAEVEMDARHAVSEDSDEGAKLHRSKVVLSERAALLSAATDERRRESEAGDPIVFRIEEDLTWWLVVGSRSTSDGPVKDAAWSSNDLINGLRQHGGFQAADEQEYWNRVRPLWRVWWSEIASSKEGYSRSDWLTLESSRQGIQIRSERDGEQGTVIHFEGPAGMQAEVLSDGSIGKPPTVVQRGVLPLTVTSKEPLSSVGIRLRAGKKEDWLDSGVHLAAARSRMTVWLQPELLQRDLKTR